MAAFLLERDGYPAIPRAHRADDRRVGGRQTLAPALTLTFTLTLTLTMTLTLTLTRRVGGRQALHRRAGAHGA